MRSSDGDEKSHDYAGDLVNLHLQPVMHPKFKRVKHSHQKMDQLDTKTYAGELAIENNMDNKLRNSHRPATSSL